MSTRRLRWPLVLVLTSLLAVACGGGSGGDSPDDDAAAPAIGQSSSASERPVQVEGAGKVKLFGTFSVPAAEAAATVPGILLVPTSGAGGLPGQSGVNDPLGKDLATTLA